MIEINRDFTEFTLFNGYLATMLESREQKRFSIKTIYRGAVIECIDVARVGREIELTYNSITAQNIKQSYTYWRAYKCLIDKAYNSLKDETISIRISWSRKAHSRAKKGAN